MDRCSIQRAKKQFDRDRVLIAADGFLITVKSLLKAHEIDISMLMKKVDEGWMIKKKQTGSFSSQKPSYISALCPLSSLPQVDTEQAVLISLSEYSSVYSINRWKRRDVYKRDDDGEDAFRVQLQVKLRVYVFMHFATPSLKREINGK